MTGAALPDGADTVVMKENVTRRGDLVQVRPDIEPGAHIRKAGEDIKQGATVLQAGSVIGWPEIALLTSLGLRTAPVTRPLHVVVLATGSELRDAGAPLQPGAIYNSNGPMLATLIAGPNAHVTSLTIRDDVAVITHALESFAGSADLLITTGGMSVGEEDHVRHAVMRAGGRLDIVKVAMKPGKPMAFGKIGETCFVGLPGNPQAVACSTLAFVHPMITALLGALPPSRMTAEAAFSCPCRPDRTVLLPVHLDIERGRLIAHLTGAEGSHRMMTMVAADAFAIVPSAPGPVEAGAVVEVLPFDRTRLGGL
jgi:molybdopterin molybdotransferase